MKISLVIAAGSGAPTTFEHAGPIIRIGRDPDCELLLPGEASTAVSRQHARIELSAAGATLTDEGSSNGTLLNDHLLQRPVPLRVGDRIQLGYTGATLTVRELNLDARPAAARMRPVLWIGSAVALALVTVLIGVFWPRQPKAPDEDTRKPWDRDRDEAPLVPNSAPLARGLVHEAFAQPVDYQPQRGPVVLRKPPDPLNEPPPNQKPDGEDVQWLSGYWAWDDDRMDYVWVSGFWRDAPPDRHWVPGAWQEVEGGWMWSPGFWASDETQEVSYVPYPPPSIETTPPTPAPKPTDVYVPGCWVWQEERRFWRPGQWVSPAPGWVWEMARYVWTPGGCVFVDGYWDRPLAQRGLLFAPVRVLRRSNWIYAPSDVVRVDFLLGALFVGPGRRHYHFGDYFAAPFAQRGFVAFRDYRPTPCSHDPIYNHYCEVFRDSPAWERDFRKHAQNVPALTRLDRFPEESVTRVAALAAKYRPAFAIKTHPIKPEKRAAEQPRIEQSRRVAEARQEHEAKLVAENARHSQPAHQPKAAPLVVPRAREPVVRRQPVVAPPRRPVAPRLELRPWHAFVPPKPPRPPHRK